MKSKIILQHREITSLAHSLSIWHIYYWRKFYCSAKFDSYTLRWVQIDCLLLLDSLLTLNKSGLALCLLRSCMGWGKGTQRDLPRFLVMRSWSCKAFYKYAHLIFTTSKRGWYYHSCFPVKETEAQKEQRILYKVTELVSGRGRTWISSLSHWLPAVINVVSQQYHIVGKTSFKYLRLQTSLGWVQMTSKFKTLILKTQSSSPLAFWTFPLVHPSQNYSSTCELKQLPFLQNRGPRPCLLPLPCIFSGTSSNLPVWVHWNPSLGILSLNYFLLPSHFLFPPRLVLKLLAAVKYISHQAVRVENTA